jgi:hypothetical protein
MPTGVEVDDHHERRGHRLDRGRPRVLDQQSSHPTLDRGQGAAPLGGSLIEHVFESR